MISFSYVDLLETTLKDGTVALYPYHGHLPDVLGMMLKGGIAALYPYTIVTFQDFRRLTIMCVANVLP